MAEWYAVILMSTAFEVDYSKERIEKLKIGYPGSGVLTVKADSFSGAVDQIEGLGFRLSSGFRRRHKLLQKDCSTPLI